MSHDYNDFDDDFDDDFDPSNEQESFARSSDPETSHTAAAKAKPRTVEHRSFCDENKRRGCTNDEFRKHLESKRMDAIVQAKRDGTFARVQTASQRPDQSSGLASKLIREGVALYTDETRKSDLNADQMVLVMVKYLTQEEFAVFRGLPQNRSFNRPLKSKSFGYPEWITGGLE